VQFASYAAFRTAVQTLLDGDDISQSDLSVNTLDLIIGAGEIRIYRDLRSSTQDTALSLTITSGVASMPSDFLELKGAPYMATYSAAKYAPWEEVQNNIQIAQSTANRTFLYSFQGDDMIFYPTPIDGTTVTGRYYKRFNDISTALNALFNRHPDIFIYAALAESAPFLGEKERLQVWEQKYTMLVQAANEQERRRITRGSKLQARVA
jgi:hypothetical protein